MKIAQSDLIKMVSKAGGIKESTVRQVFKSTEDCVFDLLSSATQSTDVDIIPLKGFKIKGHYNKPIYSNLFHDFVGGHLNVNVKVNKRYLNKINK